MNARGPTKQYRHLGFAGLVQRTRARSTGTEVGVYASDQAGMESDHELPWCTVYEEHHNLVCHGTLALARSHTVAPEEWCEDCRHHIDVLDAIDDDQNAIDAAEGEP